MAKQNRKSLEPAVGQLNAAAEVLATLRWAVDRTLVDEDLGHFVTIARTMMPAARAALESVDEPAVGNHVRIALAALNQIEWLVHPNLPEAGFDRLIAIADPSTERCQIAIDAAQAQLRKRTRRFASSVRESLRTYSIQTS